MEILELRRNQFFEWVKRYKDRSGNFSTAYRREACNHRISSELEGYITGELEMEKSLIDDPSMPVRFYNYSFIRDQIRKKHHQEVSVPTIIDRAKKTGSTFGSRKDSSRSGGNHQLRRRVDSTRLVPSPGGLLTSMCGGVLSQASTITAATSSIRISWRGNTDGIISSPWRRYGWDMAFLFLTTSTAIRSSGSLRDEIPSGRNST